MNQQTATRPNILFIVSDDQGWGDLPANWKDSDVLMPVLDRIAQQGVRFTNYHTEPLCGPSRACLFTGQYSMENGMWRGPGGKPGKPGYRGIKKDVKMLPEFLQETGYTTGCFGKWHLGAHDGEVPNDRGFDEYYGFLGGAHHYHLKSDSKMMLHNKTQYCEEAHATDYFTNKAMDFIRQSAASASPFFCYVAYNAVHGPLWTEEKPVSSAPEAWLQKAAARGIDFPHRDYVATLEHMDYNIGQMLDLLRECGVAKNTLIVFVSDNGAVTFRNEAGAPSQYPGDNGPLRGGKATTFQGGLNVPCLMSWGERFPEGLVLSDNIMHADIFATLFDAAGISVPSINGKNPVHGISLLPHIVSGGRQHVPERTMFFELWGNIGVRKDNYKLWCKIKSNRANWKQHVAELQDTNLQLFDLGSDIGETKDLSTELPEVYAELKQELIEFLSNINE